MDQQQLRANQLGVVTSPKGVGMHYLDSDNSSAISSGVVDFASRCSGGFVATLLPVKIMLRLHRFFGLISLLGLSLVKCIERNA